MDVIATSIPGLILIGAVLIPAIIYLLLGVGERVLSGLRPHRSATLRPWLWLLIPLVIVGLILIYPLIDTLYLAFRNAGNTGAAGLNNFKWAFSGDMPAVLGNNLIWLIVFPVVTVALGLVVAVLFDRIKYERVAMTVIVLPTAISFSAGSIIWRQIYSYQAAGSPQTGLLNALWTLIPGNKPVPWLQTSTLNTLLLIFVAVWASLGVAALILSAAVKNVPVDLVEAARLDGAGEWRVFKSITFPSIVPAVLVVITTEVIFALKIFDIVYVMTNGNFRTDTIANRMYSELFAANNIGHASAIAVILMVVALPIVLINIRQFRAERQK